MALLLCLIVLNAPGHSFIARRGHGVAWPPDQPANPWSLIAPLRADGAEMIREGVCGAAAVLSYHQGNSVMGEVQTRIRRCKARVIPGFDLAKKDVNIHVP